jgi:hypothetical protein
MVKKIIENVNKLNNKSEIVCFRAWIQDICKLNRNNKIRNKGNIKRKRIAVLTP